jgi:hypothetical protein
MKEGRGEIIRSREEKKIRKMAILSALEHSLFEKCQGVLEGHGF